MQIHVEQDDWGEASVSDIQRLLEDVSSQFLHHFVQPPNGRIRVQCRPNETYPRALFRASPADDYVVWLTTRNCLWSQFAYQFAHEFCHILSDYDRLRSTPNQWFHESLCELASIFAIKQMSLSWRVTPPYPNWRDYAISLNAYAEELVTRDEWRLPAGVSLREWLHVNEPNLRADPCQRPLNGVVAVQLLPLFHSSPQQWQSIRYMPDSNETFAEFLSLWRGTCPDEHKPFISQIADRFGITVSNEA
jgi:hypothetical protein